MPSVNFSQTLRILGFALCAGLAWTCGAQAAVVVADFDPAYGPSIPNLGFRGSASFFVNDACLLQTGLVANGAACSGNSMQVISAQVDFYNLSAPNSTLLSVVYGTGVGEFDVVAAYIGGGLVLGLDTDLSRAKAVTINQLGPNPIDFSGFMSLMFYTGNTSSDSTAMRANSTANAVAGVGGAKLFANCQTSSISSCDNFIGPSQPAAVVYTTTVPEPMTPALVLAALGAAAVARRSSSTSSRSRSRG